MRAFVPVSSKGETQDGYNVSLAILDELHAHKRRELYDVMEAGCGKRPGSLLWCITTAVTDRAGNFKVQGSVDPGGSRLLLHRRLRAALHRSAFPRTLQHLGGPQQERIDAHVNDMIEILRHGQRVDPLAHADVEDA